MDWNNIQNQIGFGLADITSNLARTFPIAVHNNIQMFKYHFYQDITVGFDATNELMDGWVGGFHQILNDKVLALNKLPINGYLGEILGAV
ncbi:hypothetical protein [Oligoflexus sp.]|uniref:hypothetical protein n=1 Tax=Oligoflexus sp. TaxID=1971216 RepID=UPI002D79A3F3|nr:hypothetical protein [Oligoflexus sp.]